MKLKQYGVWAEEQRDEKGNVTDGGYWFIYDTIEDAVSEHGQVEVYRLEAKSVGRYRRAVKMVKLKKRQKKSS